MVKIQHDRILAFSVFIFGVVITALLARAQYYNSALHSRQLELVQTAGQELHHTIHSELQHAVDFVQTTAWLFNASQSVSRREFREFSLRAIANSPLLDELQWRPRVTAAQRQQYIDAARKDGLTEFNFLQLDPASGRYVPATTRSEYFPIFYTEMIGLKAAAPSLVGIDTAVSTTDLDAVRSAIDDGVEVTASVIEASAGNQHASVLLVHVPVFDNESILTKTNQNLKGYVLGRLSLDKLFQEVEQKAELLGVDVFLLDSNNFQQPIFHVIGRDSDLKSFDFSRPYQHDNFDIALPFKLAGFDWQLIVHPRPALLLNHAGLVLFIMAVGFAISLLLGLLVYRMLREQRAVKASQELLENLTGSLPIGVFQTFSTHGRTLRFSFVNRSASQMLGVSADSMTEKWENAFIHVIHEDKPKLVEELRQAKRRQRLWEGEFRVHLDDGIHWLHVRAIPKRGLGGVLFYSGYVEDITERKRTDLETKSQSMFLQQLIDNIPSPLFFKGTDSRFLGCNRAYEHEFGVTRDYMVGKTVLELEFLPYEDRVAYQKEDEHVIKTGATIHKALSLELADGQIHQVLYWVSGFHLPDGSPGGMVGSIVDITAQREAQNALSVAIDQQKAILDSAPLGIIELKNRKVIQCNRNFERMLGYAKGELMGRSTRDWFSTDQGYQQVGALGYEVLRRGETYTDEHQFIRKDGSQFWCRIFGHAVDANDPEHHSVWQFEDITEKRKVEEQLRQARDAAEEATLAKSMFLANMSHEIRTPMNAVIGLAHLALKTELTPKQRDYLGKIHSAGMSLLSVINDILDFSKIESGRMDLEQIEFSLDQVLNSVTNTLAHAASDGGLELLFDVADDVPRNLIGDPLRLGQILLNLVSNAIKFTHEGEVIIRCQLLDSNDQQIKLQFFVIDSGIGMDNDACNRLFQPFTQADGSTTRKYGGTGLGLTICKRLVGMMGGDIWVTSVPGQGSTFTFTSWFGNGAPAKPYILINELNDLHVLIVDDNSVARGILAGQLSFLPFRLSYASSGSEAVALVRELQHQQPIDLVLMDWKMPGLSGMEAARLIKHDNSLSKIPAIIMVTAYGREEIRRESEDLNLDAFLVKPVSQSSLIDTLVGLYSSVVSEQSYALPNSIYDLSGMRLLVVEDNDINQQIASELLQSVGAVVDIADNGQVALDKLIATPAGYDVVLMDLQMPVMDGYAATTAIRSDARFDHLPVIAMTAHATLEERQRCIDLGMAGHITKPIDPDLLYQTLSYLHPHKQGDTSLMVSETGGYSLLEIQGFNVSDALRRVAGNQELYIRLLKQFAATQANVAVEIRQALEEGRTEDGVRLAHNLKGVASNLGAMALAEAAAELERSLRETVGVELAVDLLESTLADAIEALAPVLGQHQQHVIPLQTVSKQHGNAVLQQINQYLEARDASVQDYIEAERATLKAILPHQQHQKLTELISFYDFDAALLLLKPLLATTPH
ncbi:response regulator [Methylobacillus gramineus]|uniref:PAS domain-containing hybrid sensor histidine kinase/response regulator n=1 Tax=Methylobacillus gramineus TaxID=755169 RepID=UPI001CFFD06A|nr:response regulator [Methylobacillus gramineus]MCB5183984.1 response regulator [Methylobacillus gramineus]